MIAHQRMRAIAAQEPVTRSHEAPHEATEGGPGLSILPLDPTDIARFAAWAVAQPEIETLTMTRHAIWALWQEWVCVELGLGYLLEIASEDDLRAIRTDLVRALDDAGVRIIRPKAGRGLYQRACGLVFRLTPREQRGHVKRLRRRFDLRSLVPDVITRMAA